MNILYINRARQLVLQKITADKLEKQIGQIKLVQLFTKGVYPGLPRNKQK